MSTIIYGPLQAGRASRRGETNFVDSEATLGEITITEGDDGLVHFNWINRQTRTPELDLIIFPSDASFVRVNQSPGGRMYVLKFSSSDQRYFFWFQDPHVGAFESYARNINGLLDDPEYIVDHEADAAGMSQNTAASTATPGASSSSAAQPSAINQPPPDRLAELRALVANLPQTSSGGSDVPSGMPDFALSDILSPSALAPLFSSASPEVLQAIFPTLPSDLPIPPSPDVLRRVVESPPFQAQVRALDRALRTGLVGGLVVGLGLTEEAGLGIRPFLDAIREQARRRKEARDAAGQEDSMETD